MSPTGTTRQIEGKQLECNGNSLVIKDFCLSNTQSVTSRLCHILHLDDSVLPPLNLVLRAPLLILFKIGVNELMTVLLPLQSVHICL